MGPEVRVREEGGSQGWLLLFLAEHYGVVGVLLGLSLFSRPIGHGEVLEALPMGRCWGLGAAGGFVQGQPGVYGRSLGAGAALTKPLYVFFLLIILC